MISSARIDPESQVGDLFPLGFIIQRGRTSVAKDKSPKKETKKPKKKK
jgi:hypothetical protein